MINQNYAPVNYQPNELIISFIDNQLCYENNINTLEILDGSNSYLREIVMFAKSFSPRGWAFCNEQLLSISQHSALFSLLETIYRGIGRTIFELTDLYGRIPIHFDNGSGLIHRRINI